MAQGLAYYPVSLYIPAFSTAVGLSTVSGTTALSVFNLSGVVGESWYHGINGVLVLSHLQAR